MTSSNIILIICLVAGALLFLIAIIRQAGLFAVLGQISARTQKKIVLFVHVHFYMMIFFLLGYLSIGYLVFTGNNVFSDIVAGMVVLTGGAFVLLGIMSNGKMFSAIREGHRETVKALVGAVEARDEYTIGHSEHVANLLLLFHEKFRGKFGREVTPERLEFVGLLHDIGKIGIPQNVLNSETRLTDEEYDMIKSHVRVGGKILDNIEWLAPVSTWVLHHHERPDGKGYLGKKADEIPYVSKVIAVAETYSSLVTDRVYRESVTHDEAVEILNHVAGTQLDAEAAADFCSFGKERITACKSMNLSVIANQKLTNVNRYFKNGLPKEYYASETRRLFRVEGLQYAQKMFEHAVTSRFPVTCCIIRFPFLEEKRFSEPRTSEELYNSMNQAAAEKLNPLAFFCGLTRTTCFFIIPGAARSSAEASLNKVMEEMKGSPGWVLEADIDPPLAELHCYDPEKDDAADRFRTFLANVEKQYGE